MSSSTTAPPSTAGHANNTGNSRTLSHARTEALEPSQEELDELEQTFHTAVDGFTSALGSITDRLTCTARRRKWPDLYAGLRQALNAIDVDPSG